MHGGSLAVRCRAWEAVAWPVCGGAGRSAQRSRAAGWISGSGWRGTGGVQMRYAGANYRQGRGFGCVCPRKEVRRGSRAQRGEGGSRATDLPGVDASRRVWHRYGWPVGHGHAHGAERGHGQRGVRAERNRGVRARGGRRKVEGRPLTSGPRCQWRAGDASWQVGRARGTGWATRRWED